MGGDPSDLGSGFETPATPGPSVDDPSFNFPFRLLREHHSAKKRGLSKSNDYFPRGGDIEVRRGSNYMPTVRYLRGADQQIYSSNDITRDAEEGMSYIYYAMNNTVRWGD